MRFAYEANAWGGVVGTPGAVTDIASGFYLTPGDVGQTMEAIARAGFEGIELFDGNLLNFDGSLEAFRRAAQSEGLEVVGIYSGGHFIFEDAHKEELTRFDRSIKAAAEAGARHYVIGGGAVRASGRLDEDYKVAGSFLDQVSARAEDAGLIPSYHPHLGSLAQGPEQIDALFAQTRIGLCADVAHIAAGGGDPVAVINKYADRLVNVHLKDVDLETNAFLPLGEGHLDMAAIIEAVVATGYNDWITVELDGYTGDVDAAAVRSLQYLNASQLETAGTLTHTEP